MDLNPAGVHGQHLSPAMKWRGRHKIQTPWRDYQRFSLLASGALSQELLVKWRTEEKLVDGAEHKGALKILGTEWKLVCPKCSEEEEDQEARRLEMPTSQDQDGQCRSQ